MAKDSTKPKMEPLPEEPKVPALKVTHTHEDKGQGAPQGFAGVRSPLFALGGSNRQEPGQSRLAGGDTPKAPPMKAGLTPAKKKPSPPQQNSRSHSGISGLDEPILSTKEAREFVGVQHFMVDESGQKRAKALAHLLLLGSTILALAIWFVPNFRQQLWDALERTPDSLMSWTAKPKRPPITKGQPTQEAADDPSPEMYAQNFVPRKQTPNTAIQTCYGLISASASGSRLSLNARIDAAECYLQRGDPQGAVKVLAPLMAEIQRTSETALNHMKADHTLADAYHLMVMARIQSDRFQEATELTKNHCSRWKPANTCVTKLSLYAARSLALPPSVNELFKTQNNLSAKAQGRLWLAGAIHSEKQDAPSITLRRYDLALKAAPRNGPTLRREIYESQSFYLYKVGALDKMRQLASRGLEDIKALDAQSQVKLRFLSQIGRDADQGRFVRLSMSRNEIRVAARHDRRLLHVLGIEALKHGAAGEWQRFLSDIESFYLTQGERFTNQKRLLSIWRVRTHLYQSETKLALQKLADMQSQKALDATESHLRGVAYAQESSAPRYQSWAADNFRKARTLGHLPESALALGFALLRVGKTEETADIIKDLDPKISAGPLKFWLEMLRAEWSLVTGRLDTAENICRLWAKKKPSFQTPVRLQIEILTKRGNSTGAQALREELEDRAQLNPWPVSDEVLSSPLGPLSLADRSI